MKPDYIWKINTNLFKGKDGWKKGSATPMSHDQDHVTWSRFFSISKGKRVPQIFPPFSAAETNTSITGHHTCHINLNKHTCHNDTYHYTSISLITALVRIIIEGISAQYSIPNPTQRLYRFLQALFPTLLAPPQRKPTGLHVAKWLSWDFLNFNQFDYHTLQNIIILFTFCYHYSL